YPFRYPYHPSRSWRPYPNRPVLSAQRAHAGPRTVWQDSRVVVVLRGVLVVRVGEHVLAASRQGSPAVARPGLARQGPAADGGPRYPLMGVLLLGPQSGLPPVV